MLPRAWRMGDEQGHPDASGPRKLAQADGCAQSAPHRVAPHVRGLLRCVYMRGRRCGGAFGFAATVLCALGFAFDLAKATPYDNIPVGDPIEAELRVLDAFGPGPLRQRIRLPHLNTLPLQAIELQGLGRPLEDLDPVRAISITRLERALDRDHAPSFIRHDFLRSTPRLLEQNSDHTLLEVSVGAEGAGGIENSETFMVSGSGLDGRIALGLDRLLAFTHYIVGYFDNARAFADPIFPNHDVIVLPEEAFISYTEEQGQWGIQYGRNRWHWGPGEVGSLVLSGTSPALTGIAFRAHHHALRADGIALSATLEETAGEQLAAHRIEWEPAGGLRVGITEAARYKSDGWKPLYLIGIIPYVLVQRLEVQAEPDSDAQLRNNVVMSLDATWRVAEGTRLYGELLIDDLHARSGKDPNKFGYQFGWEGAAPLGRTRVTWGGEWTRLSRYVYTSFFGRDYQVQGRPIGFPTGPDARLIRLRVGWDLDADWTLFARAVHGDKGENDIDEPFVPGSGGSTSASHFEGIIETTRQVELGARWWPASGVYVSATAGYRW